MVRQVKDRISLTLRFLLRGMENMLFLAQRMAERPREGVCEGPTVWVAIIIDLGGWGPALGDPPTQWGLVMGPPSHSSEPRPRA